MTPTTELRQHHVVDAPVVNSHTFRPAWRIRSRLDQLLLDHAITPSEWFSAVRFRTMAELQPRLRAAPMERMAAGKANAPPISAASRYCHAVAQYFGPVCYRILTACVVDDLAWAELGRRLNVDPRTARGWAIVLIKMLAKIRA